jgi:hypothetical protein
MVLASRLWRKAPKSHFYVRRASDMTALSRLWAGVVTKSDSDSGTTGQVVLAAGSEGDILHIELDRRTPDDLGTGAADLYVLDWEKIKGSSRCATARDSIPLQILAQSNMKVGVSDSKPWRPKHVFIWGEFVDGVAASTVLPLACGVDMAGELAVGPSRVTNWENLKSVGPGDRNVLIQRLLIATSTKVSKSVLPVPGMWELTSTTRSVEWLVENIILKIYDKWGHLVVNSLFPKNSRREHLRTATDSCFILPAGGRLTKRRLIGTSPILEIDGPGQWLPDCFFLFGLDSEEGPPTVMIPLVTIPSWGLGPLSQGRTAGQPWVRLPCIQ